MLQANHAPVTGWRRSPCRTCGCDKNSNKITNEINFSNHIYFLGLVHYTARQSGAEETSSNQNATPGACPRQPRLTSPAAVQCHQANTLRRVSRHVSPWQALTSLHSHSLARLRSKRAIDLLAGNGSFLSVSNLLTRRTAAVPRSRAQAFALPPNTPRPWPQA